MSGGHFNTCNYVYYKVDQFADELEHELRFNQSKWRYREKTFNKLVSAEREIRRVAKLMKEIDYLHSGDHDQTSFLKALEGL